jgi:hypothetical protein
MNCGIFWFETILAEKHILSVSGSSSSWGRRIFLNTITERSSMLVFSLLREREGDSSCSVNHLFFYYSEYVLRKELTAKGAKVFAKDARGFFSKDQLLSRGRFITLAC